METETIVRAFSKLGSILCDKRNYETHSTRYPELSNAVQEAYIRNPWFIPANVAFALNNIGKSLTYENITKWIGPYGEKIKSPRKFLTIGVVMAGNVPLVGFHDFLCVLLTGHKFLGKLSSDDKILIKTLSEMLIKIEPGFQRVISFSEDRLEGFDAIIATGSNNTSRYFEYYFGKYPNIIRKNRNGVAILTGNETKEDLTGLGKDIFMYFGLGCRNVSKLYVPEDYNFNVFFEALESFSFVGDHHKYKNNYDYYRSIYLVNGIEHLDNGFLILKNDAGYSSPPSILFYEVYKSMKDLEIRLKEDGALIQCVVSNPILIRGAAGFGSAQKPGLWDYADGIDTMEFLLDLGRN